jgi:allantoicase
MGSMLDDREATGSAGSSKLHDLVDLASERLGGSVLHATDDFFAEKENLLKQAPAVWKEHEYTDRGKWMDGWECRRKRVAGHDYAIVRLGAPGIIRGVVVDTRFFRGNYPSHCSFDACCARPETPAEALGDWTEILPKTELQGDSQNEIEIDSPFAFTHLRFHIYPDGGVARLRVYGDVVPDWHREGGLGRELDLAAIEHGGQVLTCSDMFFGPKHNLIMPGRAHNMSGGWETKRRRGPGHDWVIVQLGTEATVRRIEIDTAHFKGNFPDTCSIDAEGFELLPRTKLLADTRHIFIDELHDVGPVTELRLNVFPDGGVSRLRVYGTATEAGRQREIVRFLNTRLDARKPLRKCCASSAWVGRMNDARPFRDWEDLTAKADQFWSEATEDDLREAFAGHPRIGDKRPGWSSQEQSRVEANDELVKMNREYEEKFGHVFLICATGRSGDEILDACRTRMKNSPEEELRIAAEEQRKITLLRLMKLVD